MIKEFVDKWEKNKVNLETYFRNNKQSEYGTYSKIVKKIIELVINDSDNEFQNYDFENLLVIDDGDYQGTQIFIAHKAVYQPDINDYIYTSNYYGSCSGCDTLLSIQSWNDERLPSKSQIKDYMLLSLHIIQNFRKMEEDD